MYNAAAFLIPFGIISWRYEMFAATRIFCSRTPW